MRSTLLAVLSAAALCAAFLTPAAHAAVDAPPELRSVELVGGPQFGAGDEVTFGFDAVDDVGVLGVSFALVSAEGFRAAASSVGEAVTTGRATGTVDENWPSGVYRIQRVALWDATNTVYYLPDGSLDGDTSGVHDLDLEALTVTVDNPSVDVTPARLISVHGPEGPVASGEPVELRLRTHEEDNLYSVDVRYRGDDGKHRDVRFSASSTEPGEWAMHFTPRYWPEGSYELEYVQLHEYESLSMNRYNRDGSVETSVRSAKSTSTHEIPLSDLDLDVLPDARPGQVGDVTARAGYGAAHFAWSPPTNSGATPVTHYEITLDSETAFTVPATRTELLVRGLAAGASYSARVEAVNDAGLGPARWSDWVTPMRATSGRTDLDSDARNDLITRDTAGRLYLYPGNGSGSFLPRRQIGTGWGGFTALVTTDWDGDGHSDVLARDSSGRLWLYSGNGTGGFAKARQVGNGWGGMTAIVAPGDFDGDGHADLLARDGSGRLHLYPGSGTGSFLRPVAYGTGWNAMTGIITPADFDGDGRVDLIGQHSTGALYLYVGNGKGGFVSTAQIGRGWSGMTVTSPGDFDGDGATDLLARDSSGRLHLYSGNGSGGFRSHTPYGTGWNAMAALVA